METDKEELLKTKVKEQMPEFTDAVDNAQLPELEAQLLKYAKYREETEMAKKKDEGLEKAKNVVKELQAPYNETINALKLKTAYLGLLIAERKV
jgi:FtsZ-binding cell division protein ZapB